jgi:uncharacterized Zn finger protein
MGGQQGGGAGRWRDVADALTGKAAETVQCPDCGCSGLKVRDVNYGHGYDRGIQRYITCTACGAFHAVNMRRAGQSCS